MDLFLTGYDPAEWDLVSHRSDGEYLSLTEDSSSPSDFDPDTSNLDDYFSNPDISPPSEECLNFLEIKMLSSFVDVNALIAQRDVYRHKLLPLTPG
jgi:hypothetical protein